MKKFVPIAFLSVIILITGACKKDSSEIELQYKIEPIDNYILEITYNDQKSKLKTIDDFSLFINGSETFQITQKPFKARLGIKVNNSTNTSRHYLLYIYVDDQIKSWVDLTVPAMTDITEGQIEYTIN